ncbi:hypothetical protein FEDK69T_04600 [Flavobacterium enshiense DK69]|nr:hypothetical protein FEDK69T_04600 [Flavobacterium enshiense DK69]
MLVNHFPIIGTIFGVGILIAGAIFKNNSVKNTAYILFVITSFFGFASMSTGEGAEEIAEKLPSVSHKIIHEHEEIAEKLALFLYVLGTISLIGLYLNIKKHAKANFVTYIAIGFGFSVIYLAQKTGTTGGEIRHTEIRENATGNVDSAQEIGEEHHEENH